MSYRTFNMLQLVYLHSMHRIAAAFVLLSATASHAASTSDETCVSLAIQKVPAGYTIVANRVNDVPGNVVTRFTADDPGPAIRPRYVEIDAAISGQSTTFAFVCSGTQKSFAARPFEIRR